MLCLFVLGGLFSLAGCSGESKEPEGDAGSGDAMIQGDADSWWTFVPCEHPRSGAEMALIQLTDGSSFCIDRYEASYRDGELGDIVQSDSGTDLEGNGSTTATVNSAPGETPLTGVSWYQARAMCRNSGAHLCRRSEWEAACRGPDLLHYPYGDELELGRCNDYTAYIASDQGVMLTGSFDDCFSKWGVYDLSGNVEEWVADRRARPGYSEPLDVRYLRGGSYQSNFAALTCMSEALWAPPNEAVSDRGFRCCK